MNNWIVAGSVLLLIACLIGLIVLQRRKPEEADALAATADGFWKRLLARFRKQ